MAELLQTCSLAPPLVAILGKRAASVSAHPKVGQSSWFFPHSMQLRRPALLVALALFSPFAHNWIGDVQLHSTTDGAYLRSSLLHLRARPLSLPIVVLPIDSSSALPLYQLIPITIQS